MKSRIRPAFLAALFAAVTFTANANETTPFKHPPILGGDEAMRAARQALDEKNYRALQQIVKEDPNVSNRLFTPGLSLLGYAVDYGDIQAVEILLEMRADPDAGRTLRERPLVRALTSIENLSSLHNLSGPALDDNIRIRIEIITTLIRNGATQDIYKEFPSGLSNNIIKIFYSEDLVSTVCSNKHFSKNLDQPIKSLSSTLNPIDIERIRTSQLVRTQIEIGLINSNCLSKIFSQ